MEQNTCEHIMTQKVKVALIAHFVNAVPIEQLYIDKRAKDLVVLVDHVYWLLKKNPLLDTHALFYELSKQHYHTDNEGRGNAGKLARRLDKMLEFAVENTRPDSRRRDEMKVRYAADKLMERGLAKDNDRSLAKGAELLTKVARLDQPEGEQVDMSRLGLLPPVVTTAARDVDETKEDVDDPEMKRIIQKYGGYVDEKERDIERMVEEMAARDKLPEP